MSKEESDKRTGKEEATNSCVNLRVLSLATIRMMVLSEENHSHFESKRSWRSDLVGANDWFSQAAVEVKLGIISKLPRIPWNTFTIHFIWIQIPEIYLNHNLSQNRQHHQWLITYGGEGTYSWES